MRPWPSILFQLLVLASAVAVNADVLMLQLTRYITKRIEMTAKRERPMAFPFNCRATEYVLA